MDVTKCAFCYLPASTRAPRPHIRWECKRCGPYWTTYRVAQRVPQMRDQMSREDLDKLLADGIGTEKRPIKEADLGWKTATGTTDEHS